MSFLSTSGLTRTQRLEGPHDDLGKKMSVPLFKDNDLQHRINLRPDAALSLSLQIREDVLFLRGRW